MHIAAEKTPNSYGVYDTLGNAWEWVFDRFGFYQLRNKDNPQGPKTGAYRVLRGGAWNDPAEYLRPALRRDNLPQSTRFNVGFRCAGPSRMRSCEILRERNVLLKQDSEAGHFFFQLLQRFS